LAPSEFRRHRAPRRIPIAHFIIRDASDRPRFFGVNEPVTLEEFEALCAAIIPASDRAPWVTASISKFGRENT
jgi:hypothetical protein